MARAKSCSPATFRFSPLAVRSDGWLVAGGLDQASHPQLLATDGGAPVQVWTDPGMIPFGVQVGPAGELYLVGRNGTGIQRSADGVTFASADDGLDGGATQVYGLAFPGGGGVLAATQAGVWLAPPGGTFSELGGFSAEPSVWSVAVAPGANVAVATTNQGVYRRQLP